MCGLRICGSATPFTHVAHERAYGRNLTLCTVVDFRKRHVEVFTKIRACFISATEEITKERSELLEHLVELSFVELRFIARLFIHEEHSSAVSLCLDNALRIASFCACASSTFPRL